MKPGELLGTVTNPITNVRTEITSPYTGRVLGMALDQVLQPGFAAFRIGIQTSEEEVKGTIPDPKPSTELSISRPALDESQRTPAAITDEPIAEEE